jgi:hypothetical protein
MHIVMLRCPFHGLHRILFVFHVRAVMIRFYILCFLTFGEYRCAYSAGGVLVKRAHGSSADLSQLGRVDEEEDLN